MTIADCTEAALLTLWEGDVGTLDIGLSYQFNRLTVCTYCGNRQLSLPATGASVNRIDDIGDVVEDSFDLDNDTALQAAQVMGVSALEYIYTCMQCKRGTVRPSGNLGTGEQCQTMQRLNTRKQTCKLFIQAREQPHITLRVYKEMLQAICNTTNSITCEDLLSARIFNLKYNGYHVITNVSRPSQQYIGLQTSLTHPLIISFTYLQLNLISLTFHLMIDHNFDHQFRKIIPSGYHAVPCCYSYT